MHLHIIQVRENNHNYLKLYHRTGEGEVMSQFKENKNTSEQQGTSDNATVRVLTS